MLVLSEVEGRFAPGSVLGLEDGTALTVAATRQDRGRLLVRFEGISDRTAAGRLAGQYLVIPEAEAPALAEGSYWPHQIEGCEVLVEGGRSLGRIREVVRTAANDVWVAEASGAETLVPALRDLVVSVDVEAKRVVVREVPGLTSEET